MFPDYHVEFVTNGVHAATWIADNLPPIWSKPQTARFMTPNAAAGTR